VSCLFVSLNRVLEGFGGFRVRFVPGMCVSICFSWKFAWVVFVCANFVRMQISVKIPAHFVIRPDRSAEILFSVLCLVFVDYTFWSPVFYPVCSLISFFGPSFCPVCFLFHFRFILVSFTPSVK